MLAQPRYPLLGPVLSAASAQTTTSAVAANSRLLLGLRRGAARNPSSLPTHQHLPGLSYHVPPALPPPLPPRSHNIEETSPYLRPTPPATRIPPHPPTAASKLLSSNNAPTRRLKDRSDGVFAYRLLNPGQISNFCELAGKPLKENPFGVRVNEADSTSSSPDNNTDAGVAHLYNRLGIEYSLITRVTEGVVSQVAINHMPVLGHRGFRQLPVRETLEDPGHAHSFFGRLVRPAIVDGRRAFGEVSWGMFPAELDPAFATTSELSARVGALVAGLGSGSWHSGRRRLRRRTGRVWGPSARSMIRIWLLCTILTSSRR
ncbi:unnamed protein product [Tuber melanosporum]|uniref:(Perigord truffle) hypothetical protein n=1 Tax=Tuber melanosporum (strain Mel28) TaxID=656061 RepID=D5G7T7_TUBMM|nr:uncharacterized protein GSTUM_00004719001 [Tuber melanosporum]CAZ80580.1 unnamed protein product [Tuber melanosporum]